MSFPFETLLSMPKGETLASSVFLSFDAQDEMHVFYSECNDYMIGQALRMIASYPCRQKFIVRRDRTALSYLQPLAKEPDSRLIVTHEKATAKQIADTFTPSAVLFIGGGGRTTQDFNDLKNRPDLILMPLPCTGGAAASIEYGRKLDGKSCYYEKGDTPADFPDRGRVESVMEVLNQGFPAPTFRPPLSN